MSESPFAIVNRLLTEKSVQIDSGYMINKILSFQPETLFSSIKLNGYSTGLPTWATTAVFNLNVKKRRRETYLQYIKKDKGKNVILSKKISQTFCCNEVHAKQIIDIFKKMGEKPEKYFGLKAGE